MAKYRLEFDFDDSSVVCETEMSAEEIIAQKMPNNTFVKVSAENGSTLYFRFGHINYIKEEILNKENEYETSSELVGH